MNPSSGKLITLEGIDGAGKSTQLATISQWLQQNNIAHTKTYEPGNTSLGKKIRRLLMAEDNDDIDWYAELFLFFADRAQHLRQVVKPALEQGLWVISDRFYDSSYAYQGGGRGIPQHCIDTLVRWGCGGIKPDLTILLDIPPELVWVRKQQAQPNPASHEEKTDRPASTHPNRIEQENQLFFMQVREAYLQQAQRQRQRWRIVRGERPQQLVSADIIVILEQLRQAGRD